MFEPVKFKHRKAFKGRVRGNSSSATTLSFGSFGLKALEPYRLNAKQMESVRRVVMKSIKKRGKIWFTVFPTVPVSKKPADVRMGKGKGALENWIARVKPGRIIFEIDGIGEEEARAVIKAASYKLPFLSKFVKSHIGGFR